MLSKMTLAGMHNYTDGSIWDNLSLPEGIDSNTFIAECLRQASEFPLLYPDADFMTYQIGVFSTKWYHNFERWYAAYNFEYEALYNVDVKTTHSETGNNTEDATKSGESASYGHTAGTTTNIRSKAAYDASSFQNVEQNSQTSSLSSSESNSTTETNSLTAEHEINYTEIKQGNQGTTMGQEMLLAEFNAWYFNLYQHMAEIFVNEFCICIYQ